MTTPPVQHGAPDYVELEALGLAPGDVLDFSVNSNPYGPSPMVDQALRAVALDRYPDREAIALRRALARYHGDVSLSQIVVGNGTAELIWLVAQAFLRPGDRVLIVGPTFGEYQRVAALMGAEVVTWTASTKRAFAIEPEEVSRGIGSRGPRLVFLCNPNNPTGTALSLEIVADWARAYPATLFVVDEAYRAFTTGVASATELALENVLVLRSMTKDYALAGLRLGYAVGGEPIIGALLRVRPAWNVNGLAQAAGLAALSDQVHLQRTLKELSGAKQSLVIDLEDKGWKPLPSAVHFFLLPVGDGAAFRRELLIHRIQVRDCASFGLPAHVRIATRRPEENALLLEALASGDLSPQGLAE
jgi:histidinol-phosphate aminotransferase